MRRLVIGLMGASCVVAGISRGAWAQYVPNTDLTAQFSKAPTANPLAREVEFAGVGADGRIAVSAFPVVSGTCSGSATLSPPAVSLDGIDIAADPMARDKVSLVLSEKVVAQLHDLGIDDPVTHFVGRTLQVRGVRHVQMYLCYPAIAVVTVTVDRLEDIKVTEAKVIEAKEAKARPTSR